MTTPIRRQYLQIKRRYPDAILLFRMGDFYETFDDDARTVASELDIVLTSRPMGAGERVPLAGIPYHALDAHLAKLIERGHRVAICEQTGDPASSRGLVAREVVRMVTPGTVVEPALLDGKRSNYLAAYYVTDAVVGIASVDITTAEFRTTQLPLDHAPAELDRLHPAEVLYPREGAPPPAPWAAITPVAADWFAESTARRLLLEHFGVATLESYGCDRLPAALGAAAAIVAYLNDTQRSSATALTRLSTYITGEYMVLDAQTRRNLELFQAARSGALHGSLLAVLDQTLTPMGGRLLRAWLSQPLLRRDRLEERLDRVEALTRSGEVRRALTAALARVADLERLTNRVRLRMAAPRELAALRRSLQALPAVWDAWGQLPATAAAPLLPSPDALAACRDAAVLLEQAIADDPPATLADGGVLRPGFSEELEAVRRTAQEAKDYVAGLERQERERTGIKSLKVGFNRVFGYYLEVSNANRRDVPPDYQRRQTLTDAERYITPELKHYETIILNAQQRSEELEALLYRQVCGQVAAHAEGILAAAAAVAELDALHALAQTAVQNRYVRPVLTEGDELHIEGGRHPVVEQTLEPGAFVPNDVDLDSRGAQILVLTGPNMSGKSTYLRQTALIVLMAQIGSFVPATRATIGLVDRIFTRVGAQDDLATGQSTFMVEMVETAAILNHATPRSLLVLDEIGRGTSTYDGISIARAVIEYLHSHPQLGAKTLFATHYHELTALASQFPRVRNAHFAVSDEDGQVVFLRRILPGGADRSYGIHVARLAGMPPAVTNRAEAILAQLEGTVRGAEPAPGPGTRARRRQPTAIQLSFLSEMHPVLAELLALDLATMTPLEALTTLYRMQQRLKEGEEA